jgi:hypothetical protein
VPVEVGEDDGHGFRTDLSSTGNRVIEGRGVLTSVQRRDVELPGVPVWILPYGTTADRIRWLVTLDDGSVVVADSSGRIDRLETQLGDAPPEVIVDGGALRTVSAWREQGLLEDPLPDARVVHSGSTVAGLVAATDIYPHGVLGDPLEGTAVELLDQETGVRSRIQIDPPSVIEGISPLLADLDGDGEAEVLVTISNGEVGARLAVYRLDGSLMASSDPIGLGGRWRNQLAVAPVGPDGEVEVIDVLTPHIGGVVEYFRLVDDHLVRVATAAEFTTHVFGTGNLDMGIVADGDGDGRLDVIVPTQDRRSLTVLTRSAQGVDASAPIDVGARVVTNLSAALVAEGQVAFGIGTEDGWLHLWEP